MDRFEKWLEDIAMGCFSWLCDVCGKGIKSTSFHGDKCRLYLLEKGKVVEEMRGDYDSYGRVFIDDSQRADVEHKLRESKEWGRPWGEVCDLDFGEDASSGVAAVHEKCFNGEVPTTRSQHDPNQGWGDDGELMGEVGEIDED